MEQIRRTCQVPSAGGSCTPSADSTLQKYSASAAACPAPAADREAMLLRACRYSSAAPAAT